MPRRFRDGWCLYVVAIVKPFEVVSFKMQFTLTEGDNFLLHTKTPVDLESTKKASLRISSGQLHCYVIVGPRFLLIILCWFWTMGEEPLAFEQEAVAGIRETSSRDGVSGNATITRLACKVVVVTMTVDIKV